VAVDACYGGYSLVRAVAPPVLDRRYLELLAQSRVMQTMTAGRRDRPVVEEMGTGSSPASSWTASPATPTSTGTARGRLLFELDVRR